MGIIVLVLLFTITINAQERKQRVEGQEKFTSEQMATLKAKKMTLQLDLNESQQKAIYKMVLKNAGEHQKSRAEAKQRKKTGEKPSSDDRFERMNQHLDKQIEHKAAMRKILSEEQFKKWEKTAKKHGKHKREKLKGDKKKMHHPKKTRE